MFLVLLRPLVVLIIILLLILWVLKKKRVLDIVGEEDEGVERAVIDLQATLKRAKRCPKVNKVELKKAMDTINNLLNTGGKNGK